MTNTRPTFARFLKFYSTALSIVILLGYALTPITLVSTLNAGFSLILCLPLYGYSWQRAIVPRWIAMFAVAFSVISVAVAALINPMWIGVTSVRLIPLVLLLSAPFLIGSFNYAFRSSHLFVKGEGDPR